MKYAFISEQAENHAVTLLCQVLGVSSSAYYSWRGRKASQRSRENDALVDEMRCIHAQVMETYGSRHACTQNYWLRAGR